MVTNEHRGMLQVNDDLSGREYLDSAELEEMTGTPASTWRWWAHTGQGPASFKLGRRRVWKRSLVEQWIQAQADAHNQP